MAQIGVFTSQGLPQWSWSEEDAALGHAHDCDACSPDSGSFDSACSSPDARAPTGHAKHAHQRPKVKMSMRRRMKASEREKLRMRSLAEALHQLRDYLPAGYSKQGQPLTKIQTLKSTIQYIKELASLLEHE